MRFAIPAIALGSSSIISNAVLADAGADALKRLRAIEAEVADATSAFRTAQAMHPGTSLTPEAQRLYDVFRQKQAKGETEILRIAEDDPRSEAGYSAMEWFLMQPDCYDDKECAAAFRLTTVYHSSDARLGRPIAELSHHVPRFEQQGGYAPAVQLLQAVLKKNPDRVVRGQAALGLAWLAKWKYELATVRFSPEQEKLKSLAETAYQSLIDEYGDCSNLYERGGVAQTKTLGEQASHELFELQHLSIGSVAPEIAGSDLDANYLKLSDYRGKVVLLVFWSSWCGPCMAAVPDEKKLVERFAKRPFVIVGINGDADRAIGKKTATTSGMAWRSFWNGGADGAITREWNVAGWPTTYVIDAHGVIRNRDLRGAKLTALLEQLVHDAESANSTTEKN